MFEIHETLHYPANYAEQLGVPHIYVAKALYLDWDRTLGAVDELDSEKNPIGAVPRILAAAAGEGIDADEIREEQLVDRKLRPYDAYGAVARRLLARADGDKAYKRFQDKFISRDKLLPSMVYEETPDFLNALNELYVPHSVITATDNVFGQGQKLQAGNYNGSVKMLGMIETKLSNGMTVAQSPPKGPTIASYVGPSGTYDSVAVSRTGEAIAVYSAETATIFDDKVISFSGMPNENCEGKLVRRMFKDETSRNDTLEHEDSAWLQSRNITSVDVLPSREWVKQYEGKPPGDNSQHFVGRLIFQYIPMAEYKSAVLTN